MFSSCAATPNSCEGGVTQSWAWPPLLLRTARELLSAAVLLWRRLRNVGSRRAREHKGSCEKKRASNRSVAATAVVALSGTIRPMHTPQRPSSPRCRPPDTASRLFLTVPVYFFQAKKALKCDRKFWCHDHKDAHEAHTTKGESPNHTR
jgi:hypothetical protein